MGLKERIPVICECKDGVCGTPLGSSAFNTKQTCFINGFVCSSDDCASLNPETLSHAVSICWVISEELCGGVCACVCLSLSLSLA